MRAWSLVLLIGLAAGCRRPPLGYHLPVPDGGPADLRAEVAADGAPDRSRDDGASDRSGDATADASLDAASSCPLSAPDAGIPGVPDGGASCPGACPVRPDGGGVCYGTPVYSAQPSEVVVWVADPTAPGGGWRIDLVGNNARVVAGGHFYTNAGGGLFGTGQYGVYGDVGIGRDGDVWWVQFHVEGVLAYQGDAAWDWPATITVSLSLNPSAPPQTYTRHYRLTRNTPCPNTSGGTYTFTADEPPRACGFALDLLSVVLPS
jgi:hypothetical protein